VLRQAGYLPGPLYSRLLREALEAQLDGLAATPDELLDLLRQRYPLKTAQQQTRDNRNELGIGLD